MPNNIMMLSIFGALASAIGIWAIGYGSGYTSGVEASRAELGYTGPVTTVGVPFANGRLSLVASKIGGDGPQWERRTHLTVVESGTERELETYGPLAANKSRRFRYEELEFFLHVTAVDKNPTESVSVTLNGAVVPWWKFW